MLLLSSSNVDLVAKEIYLTRQMYAVNKWSEQFFTALHHCSPVPCVNSLALCFSSFSTIVLRNEELWNKFSFWKIDLFRTFLANGAIFYDTRVWTIDNNLEKIRTEEINILKLMEYRHSFDILSIEHYVGYQDRS